MGEQFLVAHGLMLSLTLFAVAMAWGIAAMMKRNFWLFIPAVICICGQAYVAGVTTRHVNQQAVSVIQQARNRPHVVYVVVLVPQR